MEGKYRKISNELFTIAFVQVQIHIYNYTCCIFVYEVKFIHAVYHLSSLISIHKLCIHLRNRYTDSFQCNI